MRYEQFRVVTEDGNLGLKTQKESQLKRVWSTPEECYRTKLQFQQKCPPQIGPKIF